MLTPVRTPEIVKTPTKETRMLLRRLWLHTAGIKVDIDVPKLDLGTKGRAGCPMAIHPAPLSAESVVYSFGIGCDITWDREMIERFGVTVHGFDPSPGCLEWIRDADLPDKFIFHPIGIAARDGTLKLYPPPTTRTVHYSAINRARAPEKDAVEVPVKCLATIVEELDHDHIDVLKIDVDGTEYEIMPGVLASGIPIRQILLEVHHRMRGLRFKDTLRLIEIMRDHGYRIFSISRRAREFSLLKET